MRHLARLTVNLWLAAAVLIGSASPALAHGRGSDATNYHSRVTGPPAVDGLSWQVYGGDELLSVTNATDRELVVLGYEGEPYLRVGPDGVFTNRRSPATYLNTDRYARVGLPPEADGDAEPEWVMVSGGHGYAWHDHRIHWMLPSLPPQVVDPSQPVPVFEWAVPFEYGGERMEVAGELRWVPGPSPWPWLLVALALTLPALAGLRTRPEGSRWPGLARPAAVVLGAVAVLNLTHLVDDFAAVPLPLSTELAAGAQTALFVALGLFGAVRGWQAREGAFTALGVGAGALLAGQGLLYLSALSASQSASVFPDLVARGVVALSLVQALPLGLVAVLGSTRTVPEPVEAERGDVPSARA